MRRNGDGEEGKKRMWGRGGERGKKENVGKGLQHRKEFRSEKEQIKKRKKGKLKIGKKAKKRSKK